MSTIRATFRIKHRINPMNPICLEWWGEDKGRGRKKGGRKREGESHAVSFANLRALVRVRVRVRVTA